MKRRSFITGICTIPLGFPTQTQAHPVLWALRTALGGLARGSVKRGVARGALAGATVGTTSRAAGAVTVNTALRNIALRAPVRGASSYAQRAAYRVRNQKPYAAENEEAAQRAFRIISRAMDAYDIYQLVSSIQVRNAIERGGGGSVEAAVLGYYTILDQDSYDAALAMWVTPDRSKQAFKAIQQRRSSRYKLDMVKVLENDGYFATTEVKVRGANNNEPFSTYHVYITWVNTEFGWLITNFSSA